jgi:hypothetical protein
MTMSKQQATDRQSLEKRVAALERALARLEARDQNGARRNKDWRRTIGLFTDDPGMLELFDQAQKLRKADRSHARDSGKRIAPRRNGTGKSPRAKR